MTLHQIDRQELFRRNIKGIIWDLDNTLYRFNDAFVEACNIAAGRAAVKGGADITEEEAIALSARAFEETGYSSTYLLERYNLCHETLHHDYHGFVDETLIHGTVEMVELFDKVAKQCAMEHVIATHASRDWARRALTRIGLRPWFPDERIIGLETVEFESKADSRRAFDYALSLMGLAAPEVIVVEDTMRNLRVPHGMGCGTVFLHHGRAPDNVADYVDVAVDNAHTLLEKMFMYE